jgi:hypothetical protein
MIAAAHCSTLKPEMQQLLSSLRRCLLALGNSTLFGYASLVVLQIKVLWGTWHSWDLPLWDGANYFIYGRQVASSFRFPPLDWSPLFAGYYAIFHLLFAGAGPFAVYFAHRLTTLILVLVLLYALLKATLSPTIAWLLTAYWIVLPVGLTNHYVVHLFVLIPLLGASLMSHSKSVYRNSIILVCLLLATFVRSEFVISFVIASVLLMLNDYTINRDKMLHIGQWLRLYMPLLVVGVALIVLVIRSGPSHTPISRAWGAFMQHYAWGYQERHPEWNVDFWFKYGEAVQRSFGDASSLTEAALHNPLALVTHFLWNLRLLPGALLGILTPLVSVFWMEILLVLGITGLLVAIVAIGRRSRQRRSDVIWHLIVERHKLWFILLCSLPPLLVSSVVIRPRPIYLMPLLPLAFMVIGLGLEVLFRMARQQIVWMLPLAFVILLVVFPAPFKAPADRPIISAVESLKKIPIGGRYGLLGPSARGLCVYSAPERCQGIEILQVPQDGSSFIQFLRESNIQVIVANEQLINNLPPEGQVFVIGLQADATQVGWQVFDTVGGFDIYAHTR